MSVSMWTCSVTRGLGELRWSSWASEAIRELNVQGGCSSYYFISTLHISASYQFNQAKGGGFHLGFESHGYWRQPDMVAAVKSTRFLQGSWRDSGVYSLVSWSSSRRLGKSRHPKQRGEPHISRVIANGREQQLAPLVEADKETDESNYLLWRLEHGHVIDAGGIFAYARKAGMIPSAAA
ncbi:hypothetical protein F2Q70_00015080 [Brassica cretica]|uniref:Uncharacterized protein n=1 Tax=Brassica cretica TaxID=69181 RepID=A0A8S9I1I0_BRACR|nr:hypothetical protein F2Q70_00015080 [Brassica cretica]